MGCNLKTCCHTCKVWVFHFRNEENKTILPFYVDHVTCIKSRYDAVETIIDQIQEPEWLETYTQVQL